VFYVTHTIALMVIWKWGIILIGGPHNGNRQTAGDRHTTVGDELHPFSVGAGKLRKQLIGTNWQLELGNSLKSTK